MTDSMQVYKCNLCGNIVEVLHPGPGQLICCGQPMILMKEKKEDAGQEKHLPVAADDAHGMKVSVGSIPHPMEGEHYIEWIEVIEECGKIHRAFLNPGDAPEGLFDVCCDVKEVRSYCNVHGHWSNRDVKVEGSCGCCH
jgi:superoxide reductase